jgi:hypothetical protein
METAKERILAARVEHTLNVSLSQLRIIAAHVSPVATGLDEQSEDRQFLVEALVELTNLHSYLTQQLMVFGTGIEDANGAAQAVADGAQEAVDAMVSDAEKKSLNERATLH